MKLKKKFKRHTLQIEDKDPVEDEEDYTFNDDEIRQQDIFSTLQIDKVR